MESGADSTTHCAQTDGEVKKKKHTLMLYYSDWYFSIEQSSVIFCVCIQRERLSLAWSYQRVRDYTSIHRI